MARRTIKYPYKELTELERQRIKEWKEQYRLQDKNIIVTELTDSNVGYDIVVSTRKPTCHKGQYDFGLFYKDITDREFEQENL